MTHPTFFWLPLCSDEIHGNTPEKYNDFGGKPLALRRDGVRYYLHQDHLGSLMIATAGNTGNSGDQGFYAYGRLRRGSVGVERGFNGQQQDGTGLDYYGARYYDPEIGQFISPDALVPDATNVFDYNRYLYAQGNPLRYNDPTGHCGTLALSGGAAFVAGAAYVLENSTSALPAVPPLYPDLKTGNGNISITIPVPGSTTVTSGVPLTSDNQTSIAGVTPVDGPSQQIVEPLPAQQKGTHIVYQSPLGRGSTGRTVAKNLKEQLTMDEVIANPGAGRQLPLKMTDPRWPAADGWVKMAHNANGVEVHYVYNPNTGDFDDAKFK